MFWLTLGAVLGVAGYRRVVRLLALFTPAPSRRRAAGGLGGVGAAVRDFAEDVRIGMDQRIEELRGFPVVHGSAIHHDNDKDGH